MQEENHSGHFARFIIGLNGLSRHRAVSGQNARVRLRSSRATAAPARQVRGCRERYLPAFLDADDCFSSGSRLGLSVN